MKLGSGNAQERYDFFISYASEDREAIALPIFDALTKSGCRVWFDQTALELGDSLRRKIDEGLSRCQYGVVILSPTFFSKEWPRKELDGLVARESLSGEKAILPIWHGISHDGIAAHSPMLADRLAVRSSDGPDVIAKKIVAVLGRKIDARHKENLDLPAESEAKDQASEQVIHAAGISRELAELHCASSPQTESPESFARRHLGIDVEPGLLQIYRESQSITRPYNVRVNRERIGKLHPGELACFFVRPERLEVDLHVHWEAYREPPLTDPRNRFNIPANFVPARDEFTHSVWVDVDPGRSVRLFTKRTFFTKKWVLKVVEA